MLILPGALYRYGYARGPWGWESAISIRTFSDELAYSAIAAVGLHCFWLAIVSLLGYSADFAAWISLLSGNFGKDSYLLVTVAREGADHGFAIATYFWSLFGFAGALGILAHVAVRFWHLDLWTTWFRFENYWYYLLRGEILGFNVPRAEVKLPDGVYVSAVVEQAKESFLYWGILYNFGLNSNGELDRLLLVLAHRRPLSKDRHLGQSLDETSGLVDERFYEIRGDFLLVRYDQVKTLNLDYFWLEEDETVPAARNTPSHPVKFDPRP